MISLDLTPEIGRFQIATLDQLCECYLLPHFTVNRSRSSRKLRRWARTPGSELWDMPNAAVVLEDLKAQRNVSRDEFYQDLWPGRLRQRKGQRQGQGLAALLGACGVRWTNPAARRQSPKLRHRWWHGVEITLHEILCWKWRNSMKQLWTTDSTDEFQWVEEFQHCFGWVLWTFSRWEFTPLGVQQMEPHWFDLWKFHQEESETDGLLLLIFPNFLEDIALWMLNIPIFFQFSEINWSHFPNSVGCWRYPLVN